MPVLSFPGGYDDGHGAVPLVWRVEPDERDGTYEIHTVVRGVALRGMDFDGLEPEDPDAADAESLPLNAAGELDRCVLRGDLPCTVAVDGHRRATTVRFTLDLRGGQGNLRLAVSVAGTAYEVADDWFEGGLGRLVAVLPPGTSLVCCLTCQFSDYWPGGHGLMGMRCHRDARTQYLAVRSKAEYWPVPVTEEVPETYLCPDYETRVPGTGYRG